MVAMSIPASPADLTPDWLTQALRSTGAVHDANITSFDTEIIGQGAGFIGQLARVTMQYDRDEKDAPRSLIVKQPALDPGGREIGMLFRLYEREARFYGEIAGDVELRTPRCYYNAMDVAAGEFILLLEDLSFATVSDQLTSCSPDQLRLAISEIARFHAAWWESPRLETLDWMPYLDDPVVLSAEQSYQQVWPVFMDFAKDRVPPSLFAVGAKLATRIIAYLRILAQRPRTIVHGDYRLDNLFFWTEGGDQRLATIDWQIAYRGRGALDIAYLLTGNVDSKVRRAQERDLLKTYHGTLLDCGVPAYDFDRCWNDYRFSTLYCLAVNVIGLGALDTANDRGVAMWDAWLRRTAAAIEDLDAGALLPA